MQVERGHSRVGCLSSNFSNRRVIDAIDLDLHLIPVLNIPFLRRFGAQDDQCGRDALFQQSRIKQHGFLIEQQRNGQCQQIDCLFRIRQDYGSRVDNSGI